MGPRGPHPTLVKITFKGEGRTSGCRPWWSSAGLGYLSILLVVQGGGLAASAGGVLPTLPEVYRTRAAATRLKELLLRLGPRGPHPTLAKITFKGAGRASSCRPWCSSAG